MTTPNAENEALAQRCDAVADTAQGAIEWLSQANDGGLAFLPRQGGDQIAFPLLAWPKDGNAHWPARCIGKLARA